MFLSLHLACQACSCPSVLLTHVCLDLDCYYRCCESGHWFLSSTDVGDVFLSIFEPAEETKVSWEGLNGVQFACTR